MNGVATKPTSTEQTFTFSCAKRVPPEAIRTIETATGVNISSLSTATVNVGEIYEAVSDYVVYSRGPRTPLRVDTLAKPMWVQQGLLGIGSSRRKSVFDSDSDDGFDSDYESGSKDREKDAKKDAIKELTGEGDDCKNPYERPVLEVGFGQTSIQWPPPPHLTAARLCDGEIKLRDLRSLDTSNNHPPKPREGDSRPPGEHVHTIYVVAYEKQDKPYDPYQRHFAEAKEILLASESDILSTFLTQVTEWQTDRIPPQPKPPLTFLELFRLRVDECSKRAMWHFEGVKRARSSTSVVLRTGVMNELMSDLETFLSKRTRDWYRGHGIPHRRQYLFHGPPGQGKTSTIKVLASKFHRKACFVSVTGVEFSTQILQDALSKLPSAPMLVIEDVDSLFSNGDVGSANNKGNLSFSAFLNALDGILSADGVITVLTTNHVDRLDEALMRVGRVDKKVYFGPPDEEQIASLFKSFYEDASDEVARRFATAVMARPACDKALSMASLQELFVACRTMSAEECAGHVDIFYEAVSKRAEADRQFENASKEAAEESDSSDEGAIYD